MHSLFKNRVETGFFFQIKIEDILHTTEVIYLCQSITNVLYYYDAKYRNGIHHARFLSESVQGEHDS